MQINPDLNTAAYTIRSYGQGEVIVYEPVSRKRMPANTETLQSNAQQRINTTLLKQHNTFIVTPGKLIENWEVEQADLLTKDHFQTLFELNPELVILGTGEKIYFPDTEKYVFLLQNGIGVEMMDTASACRTYNFLVADGRNVAAALFMI